jgi:hypothetical protein
MNFITTDLAASLPNMRTTCIKDWKTNKDDIFEGRGSINKVIKKVQGYGSGRPDSSLIPEDANLEIKNLHVDLDKIYHKILEKPKRVIYTESDRGLDKLKEMAQERKFKYLKYKHVDIPISVWHSGVIRGIPKILRRIVYNYFDGRYALASAED